MRISLIVALALNRTIGRGGQLPWQLPADLRRFKRLTMGHHLVMGRKTWESIGRPLPGRTSIVVTRQPAFQTHGALVACDLDTALRLAEGDDEVFVIGGEQLFRCALPKADRLYLTVVHAFVDGDARFPDLDQREWRQVEEEQRTADEKNSFDCTFRTLDRSRD